MALSMEEQRILAEIGSQLSDDDPRLARSLSSFSRVRRHRRIQLIVALVVAAVAVTTAFAAAVVIAGS